MKVSLVLAALSFLMPLPSSAYYVEELEKAKISLPLRATSYTQDEIVSVLTPHLDKKVKDFYDSSLSIMFNNFENPPHGVATITGGWQCLLAKVTDAKDDPEDQEFALLDLLALHKTSLQALANSDGASSEIKSLWERVNKHAPCENCVKSARHGYGITPPTEETLNTSSQTPLPTTQAVQDANIPTPGIFREIGSFLGRAGEIFMTIVKHDSDRYVGTGNF